MPDDAPVMRFSERVGAHRVCIVCREVDGRHFPTCPLVELDTEVRALMAHVGLCVANIKDSLETIERLIRDEGQA